MNIQEFAYWQREVIDGPDRPCNMDSGLICWPQDDEPMCRECWALIQDAKLKEVEG